MAENAELVLGENLELQTRGILVKGPIPEVRLGLTWFNLVPSMGLMALVYYTTRIPLDKLITLCHHHISQFFTVFPSYLTILFTRFQKKHHRLPFFSIFWVLNLNILSAPWSWLFSSGLFRAGSETCRVKGLVITFTGNGDKDVRPT